MNTLTALVVEDSHDIRRVVARFLSMQGWQVIEAESGCEAAKLAHRHYPALIVLDINLPGIDGLEVTRQIRADPALEDVPILAITAYAVASTAIMARRAGCQRIIFKPFNLDTLAYEIGALVPASNSQAPTA